VLLCGDFNQLDVEEVAVRTGLTSLVHTPTRGANILDMIMASEPDTYHIKVFNSTVRTDHKAILATKNRDIRDKAKRSTTKIIRKRSPNQHANLLHDLAHHDISHLNEDPQLAWDRFYQELLGWLDQYYLARTVAITNREPAFVTPQIKNLLWRKNRLMRKGRVEEAGAIANRIGKLVTKANSVLLKDLGTQSSSKELWSRVNKTCKTSTA